MPADFSVEINEFVAAVSTPLRPGESAFDKLSNAATEGLDVIGALVDAVDLENRDVELASLKGQAVAGAQRAIEGMKLPVYIRLTASGVVPTLIPLAIDAAAEKSTIVVKARDAWLVPGVDFTIQTLLRWRKALAPDAPPLVTDGNQEENGNSPGSP
jgi:hypothetical protein